MKKKFLYLDDELQKSAKLINQYGFEDYGWDFSNALKLLEIAAEEGWFVLGGDVYKYVNNTPSTTYDNWYYNFTKQSEYKSSIAHAKDYIMKYHALNGDNYLYSFVIKD